MSIDAKDYKLKMTRFPGDDNDNLKLEVKQFQIVIDVINESWEYTKDLGKMVNKHTMKLSAFKSLEERVKVLEKALESTENDKSADRIIRMAKV